MSGSERAQIFMASAVRTADGLRGDSLLIEDGVVLAVGERDELAGHASEVVYQDAIILPGLRDSHMHPVAYAATLRGTTLATATDFADLIERLRHSAASLPAGVALTGMRLNEETLRERRLPTRRELDYAVSDRPVLAHRYCGHVAIANSAALAHAGIDATTVDPTGGTIDRDETGNPTGVLRETAIELVADRLETSNEIQPAELLDALHRLAGAGITSIGAMLRTGAGAWASLGNELELAIAIADRMPIRVGAYIIEESADSVAENKALIDTVSGRLRWLGIKRFGDGSFGGHTAAMHEPFLDADTTGTLRLGALDRAITEASLALGGGAAIHAIGDEACSGVIGMFDDLIAAGADPRLLRIEHASVLTDTDIARLGRIGVVAAVQPPFMGSEAGWLGTRLGEDRLRRTYAFASLEAAGVTLAGGSDSPVESPDPWAGIALARDRAGMVPEQAISAERALAMYTTGAAVALGEPYPLAVGSPADFIVVDRDPVTSTPDAVRETEVLATYVEGELVEVDRSRPLWLD
jgi:predicted amidohydrolase YtcJ